MILEAEEIVGYPVCCEPLASVLQKLGDVVGSGNRDCTWFGCLNPHSVEIAEIDAAFREALLDAEFLTADGIGIVYMSRMFGGRLQDRITGSDVFLGLTSAMNEAGGRSCFFLGSTDETLEKIRYRMAREFPNVRIAGTYSPPFKPDFDDDDNDEMINRINEAQPDVLWVGMTAPKQEKWIHRNRSRLAVDFAGPIGAVLDFYAGNIRRAGPMWQELGLEWLPRLAQEPRRLWRRNFVSAPAFMIRGIRHHLRNGK